MADRVAAVTGAGGFIGRALVRRLIEGGWRVRALVRRAPAPDLWDWLRPDVVQGDLDDAAALGALAAGADVVFHTAGLIKARSLAEFLRVNAQGARAMAAAFAGRSDGRFVLISSLAAREPQLSAYAASKCAGEEAVRSVLPPSRTTVVRPPAVYGPGDRETLTVFAAALRSPVVPLFAPREARLCLVHVDDAVGEIVRLAERAEPVPEVTLGGDRPAGYAWDEIAAAAGRAVGRTPVRVRVPSVAIKLAGLAADGLTRLDGRARILSLGKAREVLHRDWSVRSDELGPERRAAAFDLQAGFDDAVAWYRAQGWLPRSPLEPARAKL